MDWGFILGQGFVQGFGALAIIYALAAIGLNVHFGYTGLLNFGQAGFLAVGGYGLAVGVISLGLNFWVSVVFGLVGAAVLGLLLGVPTLRLRADYLAIVTIAAAEIIRLTVRSVTFEKTLGGSDGINSFANSFYELNPFSSGLNLGPILIGKQDLWIIVTGWITVLFVLLIVWLAMSSPWGRVLKAIREDEDAVRALGKNVVSYKLQSLVVGGMIGALGGMFFGLYQGSVQPDNFSPDFTFFAWAILILGGAARVFGPVLGAIIFWFVMIVTERFLAEAVRADIITFMRPEQVGQIRYWILGLTLMLLVIYRPQGILGDRREVALDAR